MYKATFFFQCLTTKLEMSLEKAQTLASEASLLEHHKAG